MSQDQRVRDRLKRRLTVRYGTTRTDKVSFTRNVSDGGLFIQTNAPFPPGTRLKLEIAFPERSFVLEGVVAWAKRVPPNLSHLLQCGMGIKLVGVTEQFREFFRDWRQH